MNQAHLQIKKRISDLNKRVLGASAESKKIMKDAEACTRISDYIASKLHYGARPYPKAITAEEIELAKKIEEILEEFRPLMRI